MKSRSGLPVATDTNWFVMRVRRRAGLEKWKDAFKVMRRNCETDWAQRYPQYAVSAWIGHGIEASAKHYLQVPEEWYDKVATTKETQTTTKTATKSKDEIEVTNPSGHKISSDRSLRQWAVLDLNQ